MNKLILNIFCDTIQFCCDGVFTDQTLNTECRLLNNYYREKLISLHINACCNFSALDKYNQPGAQLLAEKLMKYWYPE